MQVEALLCKLKYPSRRMQCRRLVEEALAAHRAAEARNAIIGVKLALELVVVGQLLVCRRVSMLLHLKRRKDLPLAMSRRA